MCINPPLRKAPNRYTVYCWLTDVCLKLQIPAVLKHYQAYIIIKEKIKLYILNPATARKRQTNTLLVFGLFIGLLKT